MKKIKLVYICYFSNKELRNVLHQSIPMIEKLGRRLIRVPAPKLSDHGIWNENAIRELERYNDLDVHVVMPQKFIRKREICFELRGIHYHIFRDEDGDVLFRVLKGLGLRKEIEFKKNREYIKSVITNIEPDIVHIVGAENRFYSLSLLDVPANIPTIVQLQTLVSDPAFLGNYNISRDSYIKWAEAERTIIKKASYIATRAQKYVNIIKRDIKPDSNILDISLALNEKVDLGERNTQYDFVYFAKNIDKAVDYAIESFAIAYRKHPNITLDIVGMYSLTLKSELDKRINELGIKNAVIFEGELATHDDVIRQIRKSRFALLPVKISLTTGTIREAMANGIPVVTTDTGELGTQKLNKVKECVLLSSKADHEAMAENMIRLINEPQLVQRLVKNAGELAQNKRTNAQVVSEWYEKYKMILEV